MTTQPHETPDAGTPPDPDMALVRSLFHHDDDTGRADLPDALIPEGAPRPVEASDAGGHVSHALFTNRHSARTGLFATRRPATDTTTESE